MTIYNVLIFESDSTSGLQEMISDFINRQRAKVVNVSLSSVYDPSKEAVLFSAAIAYWYEGS